MNISKRRIPITGKSTINIYHLTDTHDGDDGCDVKLLNEVIRKIQLDPNGYWLHGGDIITPDRPSTRERKSAISHDRPEVLTHEDEKSLLWLDSKIIPRWKPIADKCLGVIAGDHLIQFANGMNSAEYMCRALKMPYLGERLGYASLIFCDKSRHAFTYDILIRHGKGSASTQDGDVGALARQSVGWVADAYLGGHTHKENCHPMQYMAPNDTRTDLKARTCWLVRGGSFLRGYLHGKSTYVEKAEYNPLTIGWAELHLSVGYDKDGLALLHSSAELHAR